MYICSVQIGSNVVRLFFIPVLCFSSIRLAWIKKIQHYGHKMELIMQKHIFTIIINSIYFCSHSYTISSTGSFTGRIGLSFFLNTPLKVYVHTTQMYSQTSISLHSTSQDIYIFFYFLHHYQACKFSCRGRSLDLSYYWFWHAPGTISPKH